MSNRTDILAAFDSIPRSRFVELSDHNQVCGHSIPTRNWIKQVINTLPAQKKDKILHIGTGSGYIPALLSRLVSRVVSFEKSPSVAEAARARCNNLNLKNIDIVNSDGENGDPENAPFDIIFLSTPSLKKIDKLLLQLTENGTLYTIEHDPSHEELIVSYRVNEHYRIIRHEEGLLPRYYDTYNALLNMDCIDIQLLGKAQSIAKKENKPVIEIVRRLIDRDETEFYRALASESGMPYRELENLITEAQPEFFGKFSRSFLEALHIIPIKERLNSITIATYDPSANIADIRKFYPRHDVEVFLITLTSFRRLWSMLELCLQGDIKQFQHYKESVVESDDTARDDSTKAEAHLISVLNAILLDAASEKASDIHIEQYHGQLRLRFRIDGELRECVHYELSVNEIKGLINVIKIRADMNIAEKRAPQGGRSQMVIGKVQYDLRIQVQPSLHGEYVVIRLLPQTGNVIGIEELGLPDYIANSYQRLLKNPSGMVLVVGPTGSGKSTTLYAGLQMLANDTGRKVITVEDPIEYDIKNIQQTQVKPDIGFHFSDAMRSFVRLDPDVILIGEIRDRETALEALRASQTGHLVLSTLHCNDTTDAQQRLSDLDAHPNSIASELIAVIAQRLAKRICPHCKEEVTPDPGILRELFPTETPSGFKSFAGRGCNRCHNQGTKGRVAIVEYMHVNEEIKAAISRRASTLEVRAIALDSGLITMRDSALEHVVNGVIPVTELPRVLSADRIGPERRGPVQRLYAI